MSEYKDKKKQIREWYDNQRQKLRDRRKSDLTANQKKKDSVREERNAIYAKERSDQKALKAERKKREDELKKLQPKTKLSTKLMRTIVGLLISSSIVFYTVKNDNLTEECFEKNDVERVIKWCLTKHKESVSQDLLLFMHGTLGNEGSFLDGIGGLNHERMINAWGKDMPTVLTVTMYPTELEASESILDPKIGTLFLLTPRFMDYFKNIVMPHAITPYLKQTKGLKLAMGTSMGGHNMIQLMHKADMNFDKILLVAPLMTDCDPYDNKFELPWAKIAIDIFVMKKEFSIEMLKGVTSGVSRCVDKMENKGKPYYHLGANKMLSGAYDTKESYEQNKPKMLAKKLNDWSMMPEIAIHVGPLDEFAFYDSNKGYYDILKSHGANVHWKPHSEEGHAYISEEMAMWLIDKKE